MSDWEEGFVAGWQAGVHHNQAWNPPRTQSDSLVRGNAARSAKNPRKTKRQPSAYQKRYGREFKKLAPKYKKKSGGWKKNGFRLCAAAARRAAK